MQQQMGAYPVIRLSIENFLKHNVLVHFNTLTMGQLSANVVIMHVKLAPEPKKQNVYLVQPNH